MVNQNLNSQKTSHKLSSWASYVACIVKICEKIYHVMEPHPISGLMQERHSSIAITLKLHLSCTKPSIYIVWDILQEMLFYSSVLLALCEGNPHRGPVMQKTFPCHDIIIFQERSFNTICIGITQRYSDTHQRANTRTPTTFSHIKHTAMCSLPVL